MCFFHFLLFSQTNTYTTHTTYTTRHNDNDDDQMNCYNKKLSGVEWSVYRNNLKFIGIGQNNDWFNEKNNNTILKKKTRKTKWNETKFIVSFLKELKFFKTFYWLNVLLQLFVVWISVEKAMTSRVGCFFIVFQLDWKELNCLLMYFWGLSCLCVYL